MYTVLFPTAGIEKAPMTHFTWRKMIMIHNNVSATAGAVIYPRGRLVAPSRLFPIQSSKQLGLMLRRHLCWQLIYWPSLATSSRVSGLFSWPCSVVGSGAPNTISVQQREQQKWIAWSSWCSVIIVSNIHRLGQPFIKFWEARKRCNLTTI